MNTNAVTNSSKISNSNTYTKMIQRRYRYNIYTDQAHTSTDTETDEDIDEDTDTDTNADILIQIVFALLKRGEVG